MNGTFLSNFAGCSLLSVWAGTVPLATAEPVIYEFSGRISGIGEDPTGVAATVGARVGSPVEYRYVVDFARSGVNPFNLTHYLESHFFADLLSATFVPDASVPARAESDRHWGSWMPQIILGPGWFNGGPPVSSSLVEMRETYSVQVSQRRYNPAAFGAPAAWGYLESGNPSVQNWRIGQHMIVNQSIAGGSAVNAVGITSEVTLTRITPVSALGTASPATPVQAFAVDGATPRGALARGPGGLFGTTVAGGAFGRGMIFRVNAAGEYSTVYQFRFEDGGSPDGGGLVHGSDGLVHGTLRDAIFRLNADETITVLRRFDPTTGTGVQTLVEGADGAFYGTTAYSGAQGNGTIFRLTKAGALTVLHHFTAATGGMDPGPLARDSAGNLYGICRGNHEHPHGFFFKLTTDGTFTTLREFAGSDGSGTASGLVLQHTISDEVMYGVRRSGGANGGGVAFRLLRDGTLTVLHHFAATGIERAPQYGLTPGPSGIFYGLCTGDGKAAAFSISTTGDYTLLKSFTDPREIPASPLATDWNYLYAVCPTGGAAGSGNLLRLSTDGSLLSESHAFGIHDGTSPFGSLAPGVDGDFFGVSERGGTQDRGAVYRLSPGGGQTVLHRFAAAEGGRGAGPVVRGVDGAYYGLTDSTSTDPAAVVYRIGTDGTFIVLHTFGREDHPRGALTAAPDGWLYGVTQLGGSNGVGTVFRVNVAGEFATLHDFDYEAEGGYLNSGLTRDAQGVLHGVTTQGADGAGAIFRLAPDGTFTTLHKFAPDSGGPAGALLLASDGNLYGATRGMHDGVGTIFRLTPGGAFTTLRTLTAGEGSRPNGPLLEAAPGFLYGVTFSDRGSADSDTVFRVSLAGDFRAFATFDARSGYAPRDGLTLAANGTLLGAAQSAGRDGGGTVFRTPTIRQVPPVALDDEALTVDRPVPIAVLANDRDYNGDPLTVTAVTQPALGSVAVAGNVITYRPGRKFVATDRFTYTISDGRGATATATVQVRNPFFVPQGNFTSWIMDADGTPAGSFRLALNRTGVFSATLRVGRTVAIRGRLGVDGTFTAPIRIGALSGTLTLTLAPGDPEHLAGTLVLSGVNYTIAADAGLGTADEDLVSRWTLLLPASSDAATPRGHGWAAMRVRASGLCSLAGRLGDGTPFSTSARMRRDRTLPLHVPIGGRPAGQFFGTLAFRAGELFTHYHGPGFGTSSRPVSYADGLFRWEMPAQTGKPAFRTTLAVSGDYFFQSEPGERTIAFGDAPALTGATATLDLAGATGKIAVSPGDVATSLSPAAMNLRVRIVRRTGAFSGSWVDAAGRPHTFSGIVVQAQRRAVGVDVHPLGNGPVIFTPR